MAAISIECLLGLVRAADEEADVEVIDEEAQRNSSRWVFNVVHDTSKATTLDLQLLGWGNRRVKESGTGAITITPMDGPAAIARIRVPEPDPPKIVVEADDVGVVEYRLSIDLTHTMMR